MSSASSKSIRRLLRKNFMKFAHWAPCLLPLVLAACGGGSATTTTTTTCTIIGTPRVSYAVPAAIYAGTAQSFAQTASNIIQSPCSLAYTASGLPAGMSINASTGEISGTVTTPGASSVAISAVARGSDGRATVGQGTISFVFVGPVAWEVKTANHNIGSLQNVSLATIGSMLYVVGSQPVGNNLVPLMYQSTDAGASWVNTNAAPPLPVGITSLRGFRVVSDGAALFLVGGRTSDTMVTVAASFTYNNDVLNGWWLEPARKSRLHRRRFAIA